MVQTEQDRDSRVTPGSQINFPADAKIRPTAGSNSDRFPRVLFLTPHSFNKLTGTGITFSNLFQGWPKDRIATIHDDQIPSSDEVCHCYYQLTGQEIRKWGLSFLRMFGIQISEPGSSVEETSRQASVSLHQALKYGSRLIFGDGLPQSGHLTPELAAWIEAFRPDLIFTILGSNGLMDLVRQIREKYSIPVAVHFMDDWPSTQFRQGLLGPFQRKRMKFLVDDIVRRATVRLGICEAMCEAFEDRYGVPFQPFQNAVDVSKWSQLARDPDELSDPIRIVYAGSVLPNAQLESLADCCRAVAKLSREGLAVEMDIHSPGFLAEPHRSRLEVYPNIRLRPPLTDDEKLFDTLCQADILLMPANFDEKSVRFIRYSMPTRVPAYLATGTPILVYGPAGIAQVDYARNAEWGLVVDKRSVPRIVEALNRLIDNSALRQGISATALKTARDKHELTAIRNRFREVLVASAADRSVPRNF
jgi:glycosyltransferase involved in cell wall biosynthesis